jgi:hypothetical protein
VPKAPEPQMKGKTMKNTNKVLAAAAMAAIITGSATSAFAQTNVITLDENGNGFWNGARLPYTVRLEPISQVTTLHYILPFSGYTNRIGDVVLMETAGQISDIVRFDGTGGVWFFSEREPNQVPPFDLADVAVIPLVWTNNYVAIPEIGPEGQNGATYTPQAGQPGWDAVYQFTFRFISDGGDVTPPTITCPANITVNNDAGACSAVVYYVPVATDDSGVVSIVCIPPSGSTFPKGTTTVTATATDPSGNSASCTFSVTVVDAEAPEVACVAGVNPSGNKTPNAGNNPRSGRNPDGFYQLLATDNCDAAPVLYVVDSASSFVAGPFANGDNVKIVQAPDAQPFQEPGPQGIVAHIQLKGDALLHAVDGAGNVSAPQDCFLPPPPK